MLLQIGIVNRENERTGELGFSAKNSKIARIAK